MSGAFENCEPSGWQAVDNMWRRKEYKVSALAGGTQFVTSLKEYAGPPPQFCISTFLILSRKSTFLVFMGNSFLPSSQPTSFAFRCGLYVGAPVPLQPSGVKLTDQMACRGCGIRKAGSAVRSQMTTADGWTTNQITAIGL